MADISRLAWLADLAAWLGWLGGVAWLAWLAWLACLAWLAGSACLEFALAASWPVPGEPAGRVPLSCHQDNEKNPLG